MSHLPADIHKRLIPKPQRRPFFVFGPADGQDLSAPIEMFFDAWPPFLEFFKGDPTGGQPQLWLYIQSEWFDPDPEKRFTYYVLEGSSVEDTVSRIRKKLFDELMKATIPIPSENRHAL